MTSGQEFVVLGRGFEQLPEQVVLSTRESYAISSNTSYQRIVMVSKTSTEMIFRTEGNHAFNSDALFQYLATPNETPRTLIEYVLIDDRDSDAIRQRDITNESELLRETPLYE